MIFPLIPSFFISKFISSGSNKSCPSACRYVIKIILSFQIINNNWDYTDIIILRIIFLRLQWFIQNVWCFIGLFIMNDDVLRGETFMKQDMCFGKTISSVGLRRIEMFELSEISMHAHCTSFPEFRIAFLPLPYLTHDQRM